MRDIIHSIKYPFAIDKGLAKLREENDYEAHVVQMMKQVLFTNPGERINMPDFGCGIHRMVFEPNSELTAGLLEVMIVESLDRWLGSVISTVKVKVESTDASLNITITYIIKARQEKRYLNIDLTL